MLKKHMKNMTAPYAGWCIISTNTLVLNVTMSTPSAGKIYVSTATIRSSITLDKNTNRCFTVVWFY